jgi:tetratricopeptide (TPR) repeat protein
MSEQAPASESNVDTVQAVYASPADQYVAELLAAIQAGDGQAIAQTVDNLGELQGSAGGITISAAVQGAGLVERMLEVLTAYTNSDNTSLAWARLSSAATILGHQDLALEAAQTGLRIDPANPNAALMVAINANNRGDFQGALKVITDLQEHVKEAISDPYFVLQFARAQIGLGEPEKALSALDAALTNLTKSGLGFDGQLLRARALTAIPERSTEARRAWEAAVAAAKIPQQIDLARDGLVATVFGMQKYDEALRELEIAIKNTANEAQRVIWLKARPTLLARTGDVKGALSALEDLLKTTTAPDERLESRLLQARIASFGKLWAEAGGYFDAALAEIPSTPDQTDDRVEKIRIEKIQTIGGTQFDLVTSDLDALDAVPTTETWPRLIDLRIATMLAAKQGSAALTWLEAKLEQFPALANHPAAHQLRGEILHNIKGLDAALPEYLLAVTVAPDVRDPRALGAALMGAFVTQQWQVVVEAYEQLGSISPEYQDGATRVFAAQAHIRRDEAEAALTLTDDNLQATTPALQAMRDSTRAEAQLRLGRIDEALGTIEAALQRLKDTDRSDVHAEFLPSLNLLRAQALNAKDKFAEAYDAATAAIEVPDQPGALLAGLTSFLRLAALTQRAAASYRLGKLANAQSDIDKAINGYEQLRDSSLIRAIKSAPDFEQFEFSLWFAKAAILDAEERTEEALAAYEHAELFETKGNAAALGRGYALSGTGAFSESLDVFDRALLRAASARERSAAFAGKGRSLVRLGRFEEGIAALQAALGARLTEPENDPQIFEFLGIAYAALKRDGAAKRAFRRAWDLTSPEKRSANLIRGITAAELRLNNPKAALKFLDEVCREVDEWRRNNPDPGLKRADEPRHEITEDSKLIFNRALALDGIGKRREAIRCLMRASEAGLDQAKEVLSRFDAPDKLTRWTNEWFGVQAKLRRRILGFVLIIVAVTGLGAPLFQWWADGKIGWYVLMFPSIVAFLLLALPNIKSVGYGSAKVEFSADPLPATGREAAAAAAPESFSLPVLSTVSLSQSLIGERKDGPALDSERGLEFVSVLHKTET